MTLIIAEAGTSHRGYVEAAKHHCDAALRCGADIIKFQVFVNDSELFCPLPGDQDRWPRWSESAMGHDAWREVMNHCAKIGIKFLASVFQYEPIKWFPIIKVASRANLTFPYSQHPGPFYVSVPPAWFDKDRRKTATRRLYQQKGKFTRLQCVPVYPTALEDARLISTRDGLSDHSGTVYPALEALVRRSPAIEVHFALEKEGPDAAVSLNRDQLKSICDFRDALAIMRARGPR